MADRDSIYIEILPVGNALEIVAINSKTGREVRFVAPASTPEDEIKRLARAKMEYVERKAAEAARGKDDPPQDGRGGIIV